MALGQLDRGGNFRRSRRAHLLGDDLGRLNEVNEYIEYYRLNLNLLVANYPSSRGKFLNLDDMYKRKVHRSSSYPSKLRPTTPKYPSKHSTHPTSSQCPPRSQPQPQASSHKPSRSKQVPSTGLRNSATGHDRFSSGGGGSQVPRQQVSVPDQCTYPRVSLPPKIVEEDDTLLDTTQVSLPQKVQPQEVST